MAQARIEREQIRSQNKESLLSIINNEALSETEKESAIASMVNMTDLVEKEAAAELLLEAKGFPDVVVNLTGETADIVVPDTKVDDASRAQIEDIVKRKTGKCAFGSGASVKKRTGAGVSVCVPMHFSIQIMSYQRPNL